MYIIVRAITSGGGSSRPGPSLTSGLFFSSSIFFSPFLFSPLHFLDMAALSSGYIILLF